MSREARAKIIAGVIDALARAAEHHRKAGVYLYFMPAEGTVRLRHSYTRSREAIRSSLLAIEELTRTILREQHDGVLHEIRRRLDAGRHSFAARAVLAACLYDHDRGRMKQEYQAISELSSIPQKGYKPAVAKVAQGL